MKNSFWKNTLFLLAVVVLASAFSHAEGGEKQQKYRGGPVEKLAEELNLSKEQKAKIKDIHEKSREQRKAIHDKIKVAHDELNKIIKSDASDNDVKAKFNDLQTIKMELEASRFENILATRAILTKEQREKFDAFKKDFHKKQGPKKRMHNEKDDSNEE